MQNRLEMIRVFSVVAEMESFKESATRLGMSPQKITRIIQELELITGEVLFHRNTRSIQITDFGKIFLEKAKVVVNDFDGLFDEQKPKVSELAGTVRITVSGTFARKYLMPALKPFLKKYPEILIEIISSDALSDIVEEKIDIGIRGGLIKDSRLIVKTIGMMDFYIVGSPALIKKVGRPKSIKDLHEMPTTHLVNVNNGRPWQWNLNGEDFVPANPAFATNDAEIELDAVLSGIGFSQTGGPLIVPYLKSGKLVKVMEDFTTDSWNLYVYRPQRNPVPKRVRLVFDHIVESLGNTLET